MKNSYNKILLILILVSFSFTAKAQENKNINAINIIFIQEILILVTTNKKLY